MRHSSNAIRKELAKVKAEAQGVGSKEFQQAVKELIELMEEYNNHLDKKELFLFGKPRCKRQSR